MSATITSRLFREIQTQGYPGRTPQAVRRYLRPLRTGLGSIRSPAPVLKPQQVTNWIMWTPQHLRDDEERQLGEVLSRCPEFTAARSHVHAFARMVCDLGGNSLPAWTDAVHANHVQITRLHLAAGSVGAGPCGQDDRAGQEAGEGCRGGGGGWGLSNSLDSSQQGRWSAGRTP
ncbi:hypothetical protein GCM10010448_31650 [Streptomyces glomeratus]|uniref:Transposase n=1 Tax=Streptomyces glomeratus TaxID=284452 RepID=A0ABP6LNA4_9ACTN